MPSYSDSSSDSESLSESESESESLSLSESLSELELSLSDLLSRLAFSALLKSRTSAFGKAGIVSLGLSGRRPAFTAFATAMSSYGTSTSTYSRFPPTTGSSTDWLILIKSVEGGYTIPDDAAAAYFFCSIT